MRPTRFSFPAMDASAICASQTTAGSGSLVINGTLLDLPATAQAVTRVILPGIQRTLRIASTADLSAVLFTITGKNLKKETVTEAILGPTPAVNGYVDTTNEFNQVDSITVNGAVATAVTVGTGPRGRTNWVRIDDFENPMSVGLMAAMSSAIVLNAEATFDDVNSVATPAFIVPDSWSGISESKSAPLGVPALAVRGRFIATGDGAANLTVAQAGI